MSALVGDLLVATRIATGAGDDAPAGWTSVGHLSAGSATPRLVAGEKYADITILVDHARELVQLHREGWNPLERGEGELIDCLEADLGKIGTLL